MTEHGERANPDRACSHEDFFVDATVNRLQRSEEDPTIVGFRLGLKVSCVNCDEPFRFIGLQAGDMPSRPMCSVDEFELRAPIRPASGMPHVANPWCECACHEPAF